MSVAASLANFVISEYDYSYFVPFSHHMSIFKDLWGGESDYYQRAPMAAGEQYFVVYQYDYTYGVAGISRLPTIIGFFCKRALQKRIYSAKETYNLKEPTNRSHPISCLFLMPCIFLQTIELNKADQRKGATTASDE